MTSRLTIGAILALFLLSAGWRFARYDENRNVWTLGASYHVLLTVAALEANPPSEHRWLPIATLGRPMDHDVPFGATVRKANGLYVYTSFPPLGFVLPYLYFRATNFPLTPKYLMLFNFGIHLAATILLCLLLAEGLRERNVDERATFTVVVLCAATYLFTPEALYAHGVIYWHHSPFQVVWLAQLLFFLRIWRCLSRDEPLRRADIAGLAVASIVGPALEWSGYLADAGMALILFGFAPPARKPKARRLAAIVLAGALVAGVAFVAHFASALGASALRSALEERAVARAAGESLDTPSLSMLLHGYRQSFGYVPLLATAAAAVTFWKRTSWWRPNAIQAVLVAATIPVVENFILLDHSTTYTFDRLKALVPLILVLAWAAPEIMALSRRVQFASIAAWVAVIVVGAAHASRGREHDLTPANRVTNALLPRVRAAAKPCAIYGTNGPARGWVDLALGASAYEAMEYMTSLRRIAERRGACQAILMHGSEFGEAIFAWNRAIIYDVASGRTDTLFAKGGVPRHDR